MPANRDGVTDSRKKDSFILDFWCCIFEWLGKISVFNVVRKVLPGPVSWRFVDCWVLGNLLLSIAAVFLVNWQDIWPWLSCVLLIYGLLRVFEMSVYQANVLLFDEYRANKKAALSGNKTEEYIIKGYRRIVLLLIHNYFEIIFWLGCTYSVLESHFDRKWAGGEGTALGAIYSSFITMTTFGEFDLEPKTDWAAVILLFHATIGLFMTLLSLARFIGMLPAPKAMDD